MFTIFNAEKSRIISFITKKLSGKNIELEARLFRGENIDYFNYNNILKKLIFSEKNNGYALDYKISERLDIMSDGNNKSSIRESLHGKTNIMLYALNDKNIDFIVKKNPDDFICMIKNRKDFIVLKNYSVKIAISEEKESENKKIKLFSDNKSSKIFRYQKRISVFTKDKMFRFDFSSVKSRKGILFSSSKTLQSFPIYDIEIEYIGEDVSDKDLIFNKLMSNIALILSIKNNSPIFLSLQEKKDILDKYRLLISSDENLKKSNRKKRNNKNSLTHKHFITAKPITLHLKNIKSSGRNINILKNYGVTYKADGKNALLYIHQQEEETPYGNVFIIDSMFNLTPTGINMLEWNKSIIEGEYIEEKGLFWL